jgi:hypothetical protein
MLWSHQFFLVFAVDLIASTPPVDVIRHGMIGIIAWNLYVAANCEPSQRWVGWVGLHTASWLYVISQQNTHAHILQWIQHTILLASIYDAYQLTASPTRSNQLPTNLVDIDVLKTTVTSGPHAEMLTNWRNFVNRTPEPFTLLSRRTKFRFACWGLGFLVFDVSWSNLPMQWQAVACTVAGVVVVLGVLYTRTGTVAGDWLWLLELLYVLFFATHFVRVDLSRLATALVTGQK